MGEEVKLGGGGRMTCFQSWHREDKSTQKIKKMQNLFSFTSLPGGVFESVAAVGHVRPPVQSANCSWFLKGSFINFLKQLFGKSDACFGMSTVFSRFLRHYYIFFCFKVNENFFIPIIDIKVLLNGKLASLLLCQSECIV